MMDSARQRLVERREATLHSLFELSHELSVGLDPFAIAQLTLFNLMGHFGTTVAACWLLSEGSDPVPVLMRGFGIEAAEGQSLGAALLPRVAERAPSPEAIRLEEWRVPEAARGVGQGLAWLSPVIVQERLLGVIGLGNRIDGEPYGPLDIEYFVAASVMVGVALENARLYQLARESNRRLRETNQQLAELDRYKNEFVQNVNHELRTPLSVILGCLHILDSQMIEPLQRESLGRAVEQAAKLQGLIQNLLDFSHLEDQALSVKREPHDPADLLREFVEERRPTVASGLRELGLEIEAGVPPVLCDRRRLIQVLDELLGNAVKFTPPGTHIQVRCSATGRGIEIEFRDEGHGIPPERLESLFEPFRQGDGSMTREAGGMGLGLALARRLTEAMGGSLEAASEPGVGSSFVVRLAPA
jgi:signal transduction histidine kinase